MPAVKTCAVANQKGGVGKTTTVANLGAALADAGRSVCVMDLDPQSHLTLHLGVEPGDADLSMYDVLVGQADLAGACRQVGQRLWLAPAVIDLAAAESELAGTVGREQILADQLAGAHLPFDLVLIDCPPSLGLLTLNALSAADELFIPLQPHFLALQGLGRLLQTVSLVQRRINPRLRVGGVMLCMYESTTRLAGEVVRDLREFFEAGRSGRSPWSGARIFDACIRRNIKLAECPSYGKTIFEYEPASHGADDYRQLAREFLEYLDGRTPAQQAHAPTEPTIMAAAPSAPGAAQAPGDAGEGFDASAPAQAQGSFVPVHPPSAQPASADACQTS